jgi:molybdenum cofactor cytidylyltransferase
VTVGAVVLAAGRASRMGRPKVLLPWRGRPVLAHVLAALDAAGVAPVVVVTGPDTPDLAGVVRPPAEVVFHAGARAGMGSSLAAGISALAGRVEAVFVCLGDQPGIDPGVLRALRAALEGTAGTPAAYPLYRGGVRGHPVLFAAALYPELQRLRGDRGGREVLLAHPALAVPVDLPAPADLDTPEDYRRLVEEGPVP